MNRTEEDNNNPEELIRCTSLRHRFHDGTEALKGVSLSLFRRDFMILAGRNGSGKTVFMKHLNALLQPTEGTIEYKGTPVHKQISEIRQKIGLVFQDSDTQIVCSTVREEIAFGPENLRLPRDEIERRVDFALDQLDLRHLQERSTHTLSGGEKRKLCIAGIVAMEPEILALDEPFIGLDLEGVREVLARLLKLHDQGTTIILITHEIEKVLAHANRLVIMENGEIVGDGLPGELIGDAERFGIKNPLAAYTRLEDLTWLD